MTAITPSAPSPRPLQVGEHVLCTLSPSSSDPLIHAVVVALDKEYEEAAAHFRGTRPSVPSSHVHPAGLNHPHIIDSANDSDDEVQPVSNPHDSTIDTDDELQAYSLDQTPTKILFREADSRPCNHQSAPPKQRNKKRHPVGPTNAQITVDVNKSIKPDDTPAQHPIRSGRVYVHFSDRDRRLDRWANASELQRASASHVAAAASGAVANRLLNDPATVDLAAASATNTHEPKLTRARRRAYEQVNPTSEKEIGNEAVTQMEKAREEKTKVRNVATIVFGNYAIDAWYFSPFPLKEPVEFLYMCGKCLMYVRTCNKFVQHCTKCDWKDVPGFLIYEDTVRSLRVFEVSGVVNSDYCQRLCLLGKLFLDHKTLFFDVTPFLFYIVTLSGELAGFFSKEHPLVGSEHNVACIVTLPPHQKKGIGRFLISLSYELTKREGRTGSPERPLSDLGQVSYRSYWAYAITQYLRSNRDEFNKIPAVTISEATGISCPEVVETLKSLQLVYMWRGETNADVSPKALDFALQRVSSPRLPLKLQNLKQTKSSMKYDASGGSSLLASQLPGTPGHRRLRIHENNTRRPTTTLKREAKQELELIGSTKEVNRRIMEKFVRKYGKTRILARLNSTGGLSSRQIKKLAEEVQLTPKQCRSNLLRQVREENMGNGVLENHVRDERRLLEVNDVHGASSFEDEAFMLDSPIRRQEEGIWSTPGAVELSTSLSDRGGVKFIDRTRDNDARRSELNHLRRRTRHTREDMDVVVIDS